MKKSTEVAKRPFRGPFRVHGFSLLVQVGHRNEQGEDGCRKGVPVSGFDSRIALGGQKVGRIHYTSTEECQLPHTCHTKALGQGQLPSAKKVINLLHRGYWDTQAIYWGYYYG